jgi:transposase
MKVLVHDGMGIWLAARFLNQGRFFWPGVRHGSEVELDAEQLQYPGTRVALAARRFRRGHLNALTLAMEGA